MKRSILYIIVCLVSMLHASAKSTFRTSELERLAKEIALDTEVLPDGYSHPVVNGVRLTVHQTGQMIDHIGLYLFSEEMRQMGKSPVFDFLERYFLQLKYPPQVKSMSNMIRDDQFQFLSGSLESVDKIMVTDAFSYNYDKHRYQATWNRNDSILLSVSFPVEYELISGENKIEAENNIQSDILSTTVTDIPDSLANLAGVQLHITQISYGFRKTSFDVPLLQWVAFCQTHGCELQFGIEEESPKGDIKAMMQAVNNTENYNHVLTVDIPAEVVRTRKGTVDARLYPYVPTHNVLNMFAAYRKSSPKTFVSK